MTEKSEEEWKAFRSQLRQHLEDRGMTSRRLAEKLDVSEEKVANWRNGRSRPELAELPRIANALGMGAVPGKYPEQHYLLHKMGLLSGRVEDDELYTAAYRLQKLELKLADATDRAALSGRRDGAATIVRTATASMKWAVAVWPAIEGPKDCRLHVADRIDIQKCDGSFITSNDVWADPAMKSALRATYAVPATRGPRWCQSPDHRISSWSISHVGSPASPVIRQPYQGFKSIVFAALTVDSWVNDMASLVAMIIGYGLTTTRDLAMEVHGVHTGIVKAEHRREVHASLLEHPPTRRVWSHHASLGKGQSDLFGFSSHPARDDLLYVWVRESADGLGAFTRRENVETDLLDLINARAATDSAVEKYPRDGQVIRVDTPYESSPSGRWSGVLNGVKLVLNSLVQRGYLEAGSLDPEAREMMMTSHVVTPLTRWLRENGCLALKSIS